MNVIGIYYTSKPNQECVGLGKLDTVYVAALWQILIR